MLKFYSRCQNLEENLIKIPSISFSRHIFSLLDNVVIVTMKGSLPILLASHIDRRGYSRFTLWFHRPLYKRPGLKRSEKRQERVPHRPMQKLNKYTKVFRIFLVLQTCFIS